MAIVPAYPGISQYTKPYWPAIYPISHYPTYYSPYYQTNYPAMYLPPTMYQPLTVYSDIFCQISPYGYYETSEYRYAEALNNPGNYFRYLPGQ